MTATIPSASTQAKAQQLLSERDQWRYYRDKGTGVEYVAVPSGEHVYQARQDGAGCSCKAYLLGGLLCSHRIAVIEAAHEDSMAAGLDVMSAAETDAALLEIIASRPSGARAVIGQQAVRLAAAYDRLYPDLEGTPV